MTWHFSSFGDYVAPGDAFPFKESYHNSNLWEIGSVLFTSKQEKFSQNHYLISIKRLYHCNTTKNCLHFILQLSLVCIWILAVSPFHLGQNLWSLKLQQATHASHHAFCMEECLMSGGWWSLMPFTIQMLEGSSGWREACGMPKKALSVQQVREGSQLSFLFLLRCGGVMMNTGNTLLSTL